MDIKDIKLKKGMSREEVNELIGEYLTLEDEVYLGALYKHNWKCECDELLVRTWNRIKVKDAIKCKKCNYIKIEKRYRNEVEKDGDYEYIKSFRKGEITPNGKVVGDSPYLQIKHKYCGNIYEIQAAQFIVKNIRCGKCCKTYENSFAYHIEKELGEPLDKYWDFEKNTLNPYHISKGTNGRNSNGDNLKIWIKCINLDKPYHGSYETTCNKFVQNRRCPYCNTFASNKVHPLDSFGYHNFDKVQSWHPDNKISPFRVARGSNKKYKFICETCGNVFKKSLNNMARGEWCGECFSSKGEKIISKWLIKNNINYIHDESYFKDLLSDKGNPLRPDFILPDHKIWIEYDGEFHFEKIYDDDGHETLKYHDKLKNEYAEKHGWKLIRIPYWEFDNIEEILEKMIN